MLPQAQQQQPPQVQQQQPPQAQQQQPPQVQQQQPPQAQQQQPQVQQQQPQVQLNDPLATILAAALIQRNQPPLPKIELFSGETDLLVFKNRFSALARESGWSPIDQANRITLYLKGKAALVYDKLTEEERTSVSKVWLALEKHFLASENEWLARLEALRPKPNQPTREFAVMLADYYDKANPKADQDQRSRDLKNKLKSFMPLNHQIVFTMATRESKWSEAVEAIASALPTLNERDSGEALTEGASVNAMTSTSTKRPQRSEKPKSTAPASSRPSTSFRPSVSSRPFAPSRASATSRPQQGRSNGYEERQHRPRPYRTDVCLRCQQPGHYARDCTAPAPVRRQPSFSTKNDASRHH